MFELSLENINQIVKKGITQMKVRFFFSVWMVLWFGLIISTFLIASDLFCGNQVYVSSWPVLSLCFCIVFLLTDSVSDRFRSLRMEGYLKFKFSNRSKDTIQSSVDSTYNGLKRVLQRLMMENRIGRSVFQIRMHLGGQLFIMTIFIINGRIDNFVNLSSQSNVTKQVIEDVEIVVADVLTRVMGLKPCINWLPCEVGSPL